MIYSTWTTTLQSRPITLGPLYWCAAPRDCGFRHVVPRSAGHAPSLRNDQRRPLANLAQGPYSRRKGGAHCRSEGRRPPIFTRWFDDSLLAREGWPGPRTGQVARAKCTVPNLGFWEENHTRCWTTSTTAPTGHSTAGAWFQNGTRRRTNS